MWRPSGARAGIAKGRLYLRSRFHPRNHQIAINRTRVQPYGVDATGQSGAWYTRAMVDRPNREYKFILLCGERGALKSLLERLQTVDRLLPVRTSRFMTCKAARQAHAPLPISARRIHFPRGGGYAPSAIHPRRPTQRVDRINRIAYSFADSPLRRANRKSCGKLQGQVG